MDQPVPWRRFTPADLTPMAGEEPPILHAGKRPTWTDWRAGRYHPRPAVFGPLWQAFSVWCYDEPEDAAGEDKLRVFLIEGRAGEGKSVLLRQLLAASLSEGLAPEVDWMTPAPDGSSFRAPPPEDLDVVFVDEPPAEADGTLGHHWMSQVCAAGAVALITTGGPRTRKDLKDRFGGMVEITSYTLPPFTAEEAAALAAWWSAKAGRPLDAAALWREDIGLTEFLFTLHHGKPLAALVPELRLALGNLGLGGRVKFVWLANAVGWSVPTALLDSEAAREHARSLAARNVVPLEIDADGLRLGPPALAWEMAIHWAGNAVRDWRFQWVEGLQYALRVWAEVGAPGMANRWLRHLGEAEGLVNGGGPREAFAYGTVSRRELARELYRAHRKDFDGDPAPQTVEGWLALNEEMALMLLPDPVECATVVFSRSGRGREQARTPALASAAWIAADSRRPPVGPEARKALSGYFLAAGSAEGIGRALAKIVRTSRKSTAEARQLAAAWLARRATHPEAAAVRQAMAIVRPDAPQPPPLPPARPAASQPPKGPAAALAWVTANRDDPRVPQMLESRLKEDARDPALRRVALEWLAAKHRHPAVFGLLRLLATEPDNDTVALAARWFDAPSKGGDVQAEVLATFIRARPAADWLARGETYVKVAGLPGREQVAAGLLKAGVARPAHVRLALDLREGLTPGAQTFLMATTGDVLARNPAQAEALLREWPDEEEVSLLARAAARGLEKRRDAQPEFIRRVLPLLSADTACQVLNLLLRAQTDVPEVLAAAFEWARANYRGRGYGSVMAALRTNAGTDDYLVEHATADRRVLTDYRNFRLTDSEAAS